MDIFSNRYSSEDFSGISGWLVPSRLSQQPSLIFWPQNPSISMLQGVEFCPTVSEEGPGLIDME